jgi:RNA polymerase sigma-70 factor, ECF subfamily
MTDLPSEVLKDLLHRIGPHDPAAFKQLYRFYAPQLHRCVMRLHSNAADAEEITHDVLVDVFKNPQGFLEEARFSTWLLSLAKNKVKDIWRKKGRRQQLLPETAPPADNEVDTEADPLSLVIKRQQEQALKRCSSALPLEQQIAYRMAFVEDKSAAEIAQEQMCPEGTVKSRLHKARLQVTDCMMRWHKKDVR